MKRLLLALALCAGCSSAQLAADEARALTALRLLDSALTSGAAPTVVSGLADQALAVDPSSATLQRVVAQAKAASTNPAAQNDAHLACQGAIVLLSLAQ